MATENLRKKKEQIDKGCNWCVHADVELNGGRPELSCDVLDDLRKGVLFDRPYARLHAFAMEDAMEVEDHWDDHNHAGECKFWDLHTEDFTFGCPTCHGSGEGQYPDSRRSCERCGGSGEDVVLPREDWPWE